MEPLLSHPIKLILFIFSQFLDEVISWSIDSHTIASVEYMLDFLNTLIGLFLSQWQMGSHFNIYSKVFFS